MTTGWIWALLGEQKVFAQFTACPALRSESKHKVKQPQENPGMIQHSTTTQNILFIQSSNIHCNPQKLRSCNKPPAEHLHNLCCQTEPSIQWQT